MRAMSETMNDTFGGRTALITGASGGIGGALATLLARHGADLALTYSAHQAHAEAVATAIRALGRLGTAGEIAALAMLANGYLTNKVITVDGGLYPA